MSQGLKDRIAADSAPSENGCWVWLRGKDSAGYGSLYWLGLRDRAHRFSWRAFRGPIPKGLYVLHRCDNRPCVNPDHLFIGTHSENMADKVQKGRNVSPGMPGETNPSARLKRSRRKRHPFF